jgi:hypothetical protein
MPKRWLALFLILSIVMGIAGTAGSQEVSERKEIAVFRLSCYDYTIPESALGASMRSCRAFSSISAGSTSSV